MTDVYVASAFTKNNKGGNKAGIVLNRPDLSPAQKMEIAAKLGYSETAFVQDSHEADFELQYFTPTEEVPLCGHATIAAFSVLRLLNRLNRQSYRIETKAGILHVQVKEDGLISMEQNCPSYFDILEPEAFAGCIEKDFISGDFPIQIVSTGLKDIMLPIRSAECLEEMSPNFERMTEISREKKVVGVHAFALLHHSGITAVCRNFAPLYGIREESATGTSNCALACYLFKYHEKKSQYIFEQGYHMGEISQITVNIAGHADEIDSVYVGGYGVLLEKKTLRV